MIRCYFDSSAIVRLSQLERESQALIDFLDRHEIEASTSIVSEVEVMRTLRRSGLDDDQPLRGFYLLQLDEDVRREAVRLGSPLLRSIDAIHIATALAIADNQLDFVTYDDRQAAAARDCGLRVVQPGR
ncbi:MAG: type II toxin-antitoxin system VapC family toxin [Vicinamibacterales bacterium]